MIVGSGGNFQEARTGVRAYINDGKGNFSDYKILVRTKTNISKIAPNDFDGDGDIDLGDPVLRTDEKERSNQA